MADHDEREERPADDGDKAAEPSAPEHKVFVGGISFQVDDRGLKESECRACARSLVGHRRVWRQYQPLLL